MKFSSNRFTHSSFVCGTVVALLILSRGLSVESAAQPAATGTAVFPVIKTHGKVVSMPDAAHQPQAGAKICVDITAGGKPDELYDSISKLARFINIYGGAGRESHAPQISVVLHGDATLAALKDEVFAQTQQADRNPNLELMRELRKHQVEFLVCGQAMATKGFRPEDADSEVTVAVSGLTALVNLQSSGYAYIPLLK